MRDNEPRFELYHSPYRDDDPGETWVTRSLVWPRLMLVAATLCPLVVTFGGQVEFHYSWSQTAQGMGGRTMGWFDYMPWVALALVAGTRFVGKRAARVLCIAAGGVVFGTLTVATHWLLGVVVASVVAVAVGNRLAKYDHTARLPRVLAGVGGLVIVGLYFVPVEREVYLARVLFEPQVWQYGWALCLALLGVFGYAVSGLLVGLRGAEFGPQATAVSFFSRAVLVGTPFAVFFARAMIPGLGTVDAGGITTLTFGFKLFGTFVAYLAIFALGLASLGYAWLGRSEAGWSDDSEPPPPDDEPNAPIPVADDVPA